MVTEIPVPGTVEAPINIGGDPYLSGSPESRNYYLCTALDKKDLISLYCKHPNIKGIREFLHYGEKRTLHLNGLLGSSPSLVLSCLESDQKNTRIILLNDREEAAYMFNDLTSLLGKQYVYYFPSSYKRSIRMQKLDKDNVMLRTEVLNRLSSRNHKAVIVTYPESIIEKVVTRKELNDHTLSLKKGEEVNLDFISELLQEYGFERNDFVYEPGQYSVRGGIIDVFSYSAEHPYRISFISNEVESIRSFEVETQLSIRKHASISILPNLNEKIGKTAVQTIFDFISADSELWVRDISFCLNRIDQILSGIEVSTTSEVRALTEAPTEEGEDLLDPELFREKLVSSEEIQNKLAETLIVEFGRNHFFPSAKSYFFNTSLQPTVNKNFDLLKEKLIANQEGLYRNLLLSENQKQLERIEKILNPDEEDKEVKVEMVQIAFHEGFYDHDLMIACFTDHQIFERYHRFKLRKTYSKKEALSIKELTDLHPGDYVVHVDHGIGLFGGLEKVEIKGRKQEAVKLVFKDNDTLYVSIHSLHRISKYKGKEGETPRIYKLGSGAWQKLKNKTKSRIKDIAGELIALYAERKAREGFSFSPDSFLQDELEASFIYEDTPDQNTATQSVKEDMESRTPMDRLVCGDVGFGKTEVAMRASFKAVADNKQVAVLVPTTILALQHFKTFTSRFEEFPVNVDYLSRLRSTKDQNRVIREIAEGKVDIVIGTHKLLGLNVKFRDLGLLIIDEEQKFGVSMKEKLRKTKKNVDTLTLTATPIPRTLQFSLMGARDLSIINTPPPNRHPIITELVTLNEELIKEVIEYELERGGQVFFIHNRIQNIEEVEGLINRVVPKARTIIAHGQLEGRRLENRMLGFINGDYDILIATSIIENGLDIPNANTIIINNAHHFGLSDLHQLRGRVGRSNKKAFCYLIAPPLHLLPQDGRRRLKAVSEFSELGSGFNIAMQDLDIRGAGNILGAEQSGFIADIGFETYQKILNEALYELRSEKGLLFEQREDRPSPEAGKNWTKDVVIDTDLSVALPESYIESTSERIGLYRELDEIKGEGKLEEFRNKLIDRFGQVPDSAGELLDIVRIRWMAMRMGVEKIMLRNGKMILSFIGDKDSPFYNSSEFIHILDYVQCNPRECQIREKNDKLTLTFGKVENVREALNIVKGII